MNYNFFSTLILSLLVLTMKTHASVVYNINSISQEVTNQDLGLTINPANFEMFVTDKGVIKGSFTAHNSNLFKSAHAKLVIELTCIDNSGSNYNTYQCTPSSFVVRNREEVHKIFEGLVVINSSKLPIKQVLEVTPRIEADDAMEEVASSNCCARVRRENPVAFWCIIVCSVTIIAGVIWLAVRVGKAKGTQSLGFADTELGGNLVEFNKNGWYSRATIKNNSQT